MTLKIYRILSFILIPPAILFSIMVLIFIAAAFANPAMLLPLFMIACIAIYTFTSFNFLMRGIDNGKKLPPSSRDWIKVNAIVSVIFCLLMLSSSFQINTELKLLQDMFKETRKQSDSIKISEAEFAGYLKNMLIIFLVYSALLLLHTILTFRLLKQYREIFTSDEQ
ncbi:MAG: hypothetical protein ABJA79_02690 [Parafilimonas sp.]